MFYDHIFFNLPTQAQDAVRDYISPFSLRLLGFAVVFACKSRKQQKS